MTKTVIAGPGDFSYIREMHCAHIHLKLCSCGVTRTISRNFGYCFLAPMHTRHHCRLLQLCKSALKIHVKQPGSCLHAHPQRGATSSIMNEQRGCPSQTSTLRFDTCCNNGTVVKHRPDTARKWKVPINTKAAARSIE